uniref:Novel immune-type receptor 10a n=1 Tax=Sinocyclocheilus anshuiensis TaxID=1608454 RepID=A0A671SMV6_9TELE
STIVWLLQKPLLLIYKTLISIQTHPGQSITMWCPHNIHVTGNLYWFKQSDGAVPVTIVHMLYTESLQKVEPNYFNSFTNDCIVMDQFSKSTTLTIKQVKISDSGFYFCGATGYHMKFGNGTRLEVKASLKRFHSNYIHSFTDHEQSPVSTEECSRDIYFKLTLLFGGIIFFTCIVPLILAIIREHRRQKHKKGKLFSHVEYAADPTAVYTDTT